MGKHRDITKTDNRKHTIRLDIETELIVRRTNNLKLNNKSWLSDFVRRCIMEKLGDAKKSIHEMNIDYYQKGINKLAKKIKFEAFELKELEKEEQNKRERKTRRMANKLLSINQTEKQKRGK